jgi:organic radical activating enzyme
MKSNSKASYTAADSFPVKMLQDVVLHNSITQNKDIIPIHAQLLPTNRCNLNCTFCSCAEDDRTTEMDLQLLKNTIQILAENGIKAITITGGGEPLMYTHFSELVNLCSFNFIKMGLVTNGLLLDNRKAYDLNNLTWCRISHSDDRPFTLEYQNKLHNVIKKNPKVDWAFSYVVSDKPDLDNILSVIEFAEKMHCTHVRLVADLFHPCFVPMDYLETALKPYIEHLKTPVIFQKRNEPELGGDCYIGYAKPVITADGKMYACCGVQYALDTPSKKCPDELCMGTIYDIGMKKTNKPFAGGELCKRCYYQDYNRTLKMLLSELDHKEFI